MSEEKTPLRETAADRARHVRTLVLIPLCALGLGYLGTCLLPFFSVTHYGNPHQGHLPTPADILIPLLTGVLGAYLGYWLARIGRRG